MVKYLTFIVLLLCSNVIGIYNFHYTEKDLEAEAWIEKQAEAEIEYSYGELDHGY